MVSILECSGGIFRLNALKIVSIITVSFNSCVDHVHIVRKKFNDDIRIKLWICLVYQTFRSKTPPKVMVCCTSSILKCADIEDLLIFRYN